MERTVRPLWTSWSCKNVRVLWRTANGDFYTSSKRSATIGFYEKSCQTAHFGIVPGMAFSYDTGVFSRHGGVFRVVRRRERAEQKTINFDRGSLCRPRRRLPQLRWVTLDVPQTVAAKNICIRGSSGSATGQTGYWPRLVRGSAFKNKAWVKK